MRWVSLLRLGCKKDYDFLLAWAHSTLEPSVQREQAAPWSPRPGVEWLGMDFPQAGFEMTAALAVLLTAAL